MKEASTLTSERDLSDYFEHTLKSYGGAPKTAANWVINDLLGLVNDLELSLEELYLIPERLAEIIKLVDAGKINTSTGRELVRKTEQNKKEPDQIVEEEGLAQLTDTSAIEAICQQVIEANPNQTEEYKSGKKGVIGWFIGQVMSQSGGKADPQAVREILIRLLEG